MSVGTYVERGALGKFLDFKDLAAGLLDTNIPAVTGEMSVDRLIEFINTSKLMALVLVTRDDEPAFDVGREALRRTGEDPFAMSLVDVASLCGHVESRAEATAKACRVLSATAAMVRAYPWLKPENARLRLGGLRGRLSRRQLLTAPRPRYDVIPAIDGEHCAAGRGCNLCFEACPFGAISLNGASASVDKNRCRDCGLCIAVCPTGAADHPYYRRRVLEAGLSALLAGHDQDGYGRIIAFACGGGMRILREAGDRRTSFPSAILPLQVPSAGFVDLYLVLRAFDLGAAGAAILGCEGACQSGCRPEPSSDRFAAIERVLDLLGGQGQRLALVSAASAERLAERLTAFADHVAALPAPAAGRKTPVSADPRVPEPSATARLICDMARRLGVGGVLSMEHEGLPFGVPEFTSERCSLCGLCADACPTSALTYSETPDIAELRFAPRDCTGCRLCSAACPEDALRIVRRFDSSLLLKEPLTLKDAGLVRCTRCGGAYAPEALVQRVLSQLGDDAATSIGQYCPDCRMLAPRGG